MHVFNSSSVKSEKYNLITKINNYSIVYIIPSTTEYLEDDDISKSNYEKLAKYREEIIKSITERTGGDLYLGVVGAVRTGKSTFIKKMIENLVVPNIKNESDKKVIQAFKAKDNTTSLNIFESIQPQDLIKYGMIPEFVGRLPIVTTLNSLDEEALVRILCEPRNALIKQYQHFLAMDDVELEFTEDSLIAIADRALERNTGARGLRAILEKTMNDIMYEVPSNPKIAKVIVTKECITEGKEPDIVRRKAKRTATAKPSATTRRNSP